MFTSQQNFAIVQTELDSVFYQEFDMLDSFPGVGHVTTPALFKQVTTTHAAYIEEVFKGSGLFPKVGEVQTVPTATPRVANKFTVLIEDFAQGISISKNLFDDNMHNVWERTVRDLATKARSTMDKNGFSLYNGMFTTSLSADGDAVISATHSLIGGGTASNLISGALTPTTLNLGVVALMQQVDQTGTIMGNTPAVLLVAPANWKHAIEITESALIADSGNNNINIYRSALGLEVYTSPWLSAAAGGSDTAWFLLARNHSVTRYIRQGIETSLRDWGQSDNRTYLYQANFREAVACIDYAGIVGSLGT